MTPSAQWRQRGIALRPAASTDAPFLRALYGETRADEMAAAGWPASARDRFLDRQFELQTRHFDAHYGHGAHLIVLAGEVPVGRLWLCDVEDACLVVDIAIIHAWRGQGLGYDLLRQVQRAARRRGRKRVTLHVLIGNWRAKALYERLGFVELRRTQTHIGMDCPVG